MNGWCRFKSQLLLQRAVLGAAALAMAGAAPADEQKTPVHVICTAQLICTSIVAGSKDRFDPLIQQLLARGQLDSQPRGWQLLYIYVPDADTQSLEELRIRFLDELLQRQREREAEKAAHKDTAPSAHP